MRTKLLIAAVAVAAFATPSLAAEFYIVQDTATKRCTIVDQRPTTTTTTIVGPGTTYTTRTEAESAMRTVKVCESAAPSAARRSYPAPHRADVQLSVI